MDVIPFTTLYALAILLTAVVLSRRLLPDVLGAGFVQLLWLVLVAASFDVAIHDGGTVTRYSYESLAFFAVAGFGLNLVFLFASVTGRLPSRRGGGVGDVR